MKKDTLVKAAYIYLNEMDFESQQFVKVAYKVIILVVAVIGLLAKQGAFFHSGILYGAVLRVRVLDDWCGCALHSGRIRHEVSYSHQPGLCGSEKSSPGRRIND